MRATDDVSRDWRPYTVAFVPRNPERRQRLVEVANQLEGRAGFTSVVRILRGTGPVVRKQAASVDVELQRELEHSHPSTFGRVVVAESLADGVAAVLQAHGIGPLSPNIALFNLAHPDIASSESGDEWGSMIQTARRFGSNVAVYHSNPDHVAERRVIDVWWADDRSGSLLVLLGWLMTRSAAWNGADVRVWIERSDEQGSGELDRVREVLADARLPVRVAGTAQPDAFNRTVQDAQFVLAPMRIKHGEGYGPTGASVVDLVDAGLPSGLFVHTGEEVALDVQPDQSLSTQLADALDRAEQLRSRAHELSDTAAALVVRAEMARLEASGDESSPEVIAATTDAAAAQRTYLDARARAEDAFLRVRSLDPSATEGTLDPDIWLAERTPDDAAFIRDR